MNIKFPLCGISSEIKGFPVCGCFGFWKLESSFVLGMKVFLRVRDSNFVDWRKSLIILRWKRLRFEGKTWSFRCFRKDEKSFQSLSLFCEVVMICFLAERCWGGMRRFDAEVLSDAYQLTIDLCSLRLLVFEAICFEEQTVFPEKSVSRPFPLFC
jgi:hypothetical protein